MTTFELNHIFVGNEEADILIIFLHEGLGSIGQWKNFPLQLCDEIGVSGLIYDRSGYGRSLGDLTNRQPNYLRLAAEELIQIVTPIQKEYDQIFLYGHSDGGSIALIAAALYPSWFSGIITEAAHVFVEEKTIKGVQSARLLFEKGLFDGLEKYHGKRYREVFYAWNDIWLSTGFKDWNIEKLLHQITCPQLIIQGDEDEYATLKQVDSIIKNTNSESQVFIPKHAGHAPHKTNTKEVLITCKGFIDAIIRKEL